MEYISNTQLELAEAYVMNTGVSVFLTGKAGTGKTTFLRHLIEHTTKRHVIVAPTGVAAVNAGGVTIHSFFQLPLCPYLPDVPELITEYQMPEHKLKLRKERLNVIRTLDLLIIDEISMVRADLLDAIDWSLRRFRRSSRPFGGVQLLMIGDVHQLPPVVTESDRPYMDRVYPSPFFFHSKALQRVPFVTIELQTIYRQQDAEFVDLLNHIRDNRFTPEVLDRLNQRHLPDFDPDKADKPYIRLTTHNYQADAINRRKLAELKSDQQLFQAEVSGNYPDSALPTEMELTLKVGEQVMFVKNDSSGQRRYYNGKIATITGFVDQDVHLVDDQGTEITVTTETWENLRYEVDPSDNEIKARLEGSFTQVPLRPAWAVTIHKAQGLTFDRVVVDAASAFTYGQVYVALSRCRTFQGLVLSSRIGSNCMIDNGDVTAFCSQLPSEEQMRQVLPDCQKSYLIDQVGELFSFEAFHHQADRLRRLFDEHLRSTYAIHLKNITTLTDTTLVDLMGVGERFRRQLTRMAAQNQPIDDRIRQGATYFLDQLGQIALRIANLTSLEIDNVEVERQYDDLSEGLLEIYGLKHACLRHVLDHGFTIQGYGKAKASYLLNKDKKKPSKVDTLEQTAHPKLAKELRRWRKSLAADLEIKPFNIMTQKTLIAIANQLPSTPKALAKMPDFGKFRMEKYGDQVLEIINEYIASAQKD